MRRSRVLFVALAVIAVAVFALGAFGVGVLRSGRALQAQMDAAISALEASRWDDAKQSLASLETGSRDLSNKLDGPLSRVLSPVPLAGRTIKSARALAEGATLAANAASDVMPILEAGNFWHDGQVDLEALQTLRAFAAKEQPDIKTALEKVEQSPSWPLPGVLARARNDAVKRLRSASHSIDIAIRAIDLSAAVFGSSGPRRYFIAFENPSEMRGAGGLWGNWGILKAENGRLRLGRFGRIKDLQKFATTRGPDWYEARYAQFGASTEWNQMSTAPDFPTVASIAEADLRGAPDIGPIDGVIAIDPVGLAGMLRVTGAIQVASWPDPITTDNIVQKTLHDAYSHFTTNEERIAFLGETAQAVWSRMVGGDISIQGLAKSGLGAAVEGKHLRLHLVRPEEQQLAEALNAAGGIGDPSRTIGLVTQNIAGHKMDFWLHRSLDLAISLRSDGGATGTATIKLENRGPSSGEPQYVIGPFDERYKAGWNTQFIRLYLPGSTQIATKRSGGAGIANELGFVVAEWNVDVPPGGNIHRSLNFDIADAWDPKSGRLDLNLRRQAFLAPDSFRLSVEPPWGKSFIFERSEACTKGTTRADVPIVGPLKTTLWGWIVGPWARDASCG